jgi:hypothetical protein
MSPCSIIVLVHHPCSISIYSTLVLGRLSLPFVIVQCGLYPLTSYVYQHDAAVESISLLQINHGDCYPCSDSKVYHLGFLLCFLFFSMDSFVPRCYKAQILVSNPTAILVTRLCFFGLFDDFLDKYMFHHR